MPRWLPSMLRVTQINLHRSKTASAALLLRLSRSDWELVLVQEPWTVNGKVCGLNAVGYHTVYVQDKGRPRACVMVKNSINAFLLHRFSDKDTVAMVVTLGSVSLWTVSSYLAHDYGLSPPQEPVCQLVAEAHVRGIPVLVGCDANAHHVVWGSSDTNERGECLFDFILTYNLRIANRGNEPTFITSNRREVLDITLVSENLSDKIVNWHVSSECSFSDHRYIVFTVELSVSPCREIISVNRRGTNWPLFRDKLRSGLPESPPHIRTYSDIEVAVDVLSTALRDAAASSTKIPVYRGRPRPYWWNQEIENLRRLSGRLFNRAKATGEWDLYKAKKRELKYAIRRAKRASWRDFCESVESSAEVSRLRRILSSSKGSLESIRRPDGSWTTSIDETIDLLLDTHFPGSVPVADRAALQVDTPLVGCHCSSVRISSEQLHWAIGSFEPFKSPGPDGIIPADLQNGEDLILPWLLAVFNACLDLIYIPLCWRIAKVVFIPKSGRTSHVNPGDFRPISLCSFLLKTLERVLDLHIRNSIDSSLMSTSQHAYMKGRSVETALHSLISQVERSLHFRQYTLVAFLDIEGAFNNVCPMGIIRALYDLGLDPGLVKFVELLLRSRLVSTTVGTVQCQRLTARGTPQGGVLSPLLWNLAVNTLLTQLERSGNRVVAYADDIAIAASGICPQTLSDKLNFALGIVSGWCGEFGLSANPGKTDIMLFTRRYKVPHFTLPSLNGVRLRLSTAVKYLGLILDPKLNWGPNLAERARKAACATYCCRKAVGAKWGLSPRVIRWIYSAIIEPNLFYGVVFWWTALDRDRNVRLFDKVRRSTAVQITGALRTTPTKALFVMLGWLPSRILARQRAKLVAVRLDALSRWDIILSGHSSILLEDPHIRDDIDYASSRLELHKNFHAKIPSRDDWASGRVIPSGSVEVYTDGSRIGNRVGCGIYSERLNLSVSLRLPDYCSVFQAEIMAIYHATNLIIQGGAPTTSISIFSDSQAAVRSLSGYTTNSKLVRCCRDSLGILSRQLSVDLIWVPGHRNIIGNCTADELARAGTSLPSVHPHMEVGIPLSSVRLSIRRKYQLDAGVSWAEEESCHVARLTWPRLDMRRTNQLFKLDRRDISSTVSILTGHCVMGRHAERMRLPANDFCRGCGSIEEEETVVHYICQCPSLARRRLLTLGSPFLDSLTDLSTLDIKSIANFIRLSGWFP